MKGTLNTLHFLYSFSAGAFLGVSALITAFRQANPLIPLLFLPLILYFSIESYHRLYRWSASAHEPNQSFHFLLFLSQDNPLFLITLGFFLLALSLSIIKGLILP